MLAHFCIYSACKYPFMKPPCVAKSLYNVTGPCYSLSSGFWLEQPRPSRVLTVNGRHRRLLSALTLSVRATCEGSKVQILVLVSFLRFHLQCPNSTPTDGWEWGLKRLKYGGAESFWLDSRLVFPPAPILKCLDIATAQKLTLLADAGASDDRVLRGKQQHTRFTRSLSADSFCAGT